MRENNLHFLYSIRYRRRRIWHIYIHIIVDVFYHWWLLSNFVTRLLQSTSDERWSFLLYFSRIIVMPPKLLQRHNYTFIIFFRGEKRSRENVDVYFFVNWGWGNINPVSFLYRFSDVFLGYRNGTLYYNGLTYSFLRHPFSIPWKYQKTVGFSDVFRG